MILDDLEINDINDLPDGVEDGDQVIGKICRHAIRLRLEDDVGEGQEHAEEEEPAS